MNLLTYLSKRFLSLRHHRGFGVHSPYAYRFVTDVIKTGDYGYYAYDFIDDCEGIDHRTANKAKWLIRLTTFLNSKRIIASPSILPEFHLAAKANGIICDNIDEKELKPGDLLILTDKPPQLDIVKNALMSKAAVLALNPDNELRNILTTPLPKGLLLEDKDKILLIPRDEMEYIAYDIRF